jgi:hypothetical protein
MNLNDIAMPFSTTVTGLTFTPTTGVLSLTSGYVVPTTTEETNWNTAYSYLDQPVLTTSSPAFDKLIANSIGMNSADTVLDVYQVSGAPPSPDVRGSYVYTGQYNGKDYFALNTSYYIYYDTTSSEYWLSDTLGYTGSNSWFIVSSDYIGTYTPISPATGSLTVGEIYVNMQRPASRRAIVIKAEGSEDEIFTFDTLNGNLALSGDMAAESGTFASDVTIGVEVLTANIITYLNDLDQHLASTSGVTHASLTVTDYIEATNQIAAGGTLSGYDIDIGGYVLDANEFSFLDGQDQAVRTFDSPSFVDLLLTQKITTYNNIATVNGGIPSILATVDLAAQSAAKSATTIYTPTASGIFRISIILQITTKATTSSVLGGATGVTITFTEPDGSVAQSIKPLLTSQLGAVIVPATGNTANSTVTQSQGLAVINAKAEVSIQYAIGYTSVGGTAMQYAAHLKVEAM